MAKNFNETLGSAKKGVPAYAMVDGENKVRLIGGILARYVYWVKAPGSTGNGFPVECLSFDRDQERFTNTEVDHVPSFFPGLKCQWAYGILCIDPKDNKVKALHLKKNLLAQILSAAEDLGDPTDPVTGWWCVFKRQKTGPLPINISYDLQVLRCKPQPLTEEQIAAVAEFGDIDTHFKRATPDEIKAQCEKLLSGGKDAEAAPAALTDSEAEAVNELDADVNM